MSLPTLLTISGSLRAGSFNTAILEHFAQFANGQANVAHSHYLGQLPLYNQDLDTDTPPAVVGAARAENHTDSGGFFESDVSRVYNQISLKKERIWF